MERSSPIFCVFSSCPELINFFISFSAQLRRWYGVGLVFCFDGVCPGSSSILISVSHDLDRFEKFFKVCSYFVV